MMVSKKKWLVMDNSEMLPQKVDGSLKSFRLQPSQKTDAQQTDSLSKKHGSSRSTWLGAPIITFLCFN